MESVEGDIEMASRDPPRQVQLFAPSTPMPGSLTGAPLLSTPCASTSPYRARECIALLSICNTGNFDGGEIHAGAILHQGSQLCNPRLPQPINGKKLDMSSCSAAPLTPPLSTTGFAEPDLTGASPNSQGPWRNACGKGCVQFAPRDWPKGAWKYPFSRPTLLQFFQGL